MFQMNRKIPCSGHDEPSASWTHDDDNKGLFEEHLPAVLSQSVDEMVAGPRSNHGNVLLVTRPRAPTD